MLIRLAFLLLLVATLLVPVFSPPAVQAQDSSLSTASSVAQGRSVLESQSDWDALYDQLHPDSQLTVGRSTVAYWYRTYFAVNGPHPATITGAALVDWTWPVTGRTYPATAEISYSQVFDNGTTVNDVVRLVQAEDGSWRWFFGRSPEFVRQIAQEAGEFRQDLSIPERAGLPAAILFAEAIGGIDRVLPACFVAAGIAQLPQTIGVDSINVRQSESGGRPESASFLPPDRRDFPDLIANALPLPPGNTPETTLDHIRARQIDWNGPPYSSPPRGLVVDLAPESPYLILYYEESTEALGFLPVLMWGPRGTNALFTVVGPASGLINELVAEWSANARASCVG
jgi:hypothetical protein